MNNSKIEIHKDGNKAKLLEAFWKLGEFSGKLRVEGLKQINDHLRQINHETQQDDLNYILMRLIRGLASNRKCARLGFSCALTYIISNYKFISYEDIMKIAEKELVAPDQQQQAASQHILTNEEVRNIHIGNAFVYLCLIQSERKEDLDENAELIVEKLNQKRKSFNKLYIQQFYLETIILLIKKIANEKLFEKKILPKLIDELKVGWQTATLNQNCRDSLQLLLSCSNTYPKVIEKHVNIEEHWQNKNLLVANEERLYEFIRTCSESLPKLHSFCQELFSYALNSCSPKEFDKFWTNYVEQRLCNKKELEKKCLSFNIWLYCIEKCPKDDHDLKIMKVLLSKNVCSSFINNYLHNNTNLHMIVQQLYKQLVDILRKKEHEAQESITCEFAMKFMSLVPNFYELSDMIASFILTMNSNGLKKFYAHLVGHLTSKSEESEVDEDEFKNKQIWLLNQLSAFCKNSALCEANFDCLKDLLEFFLTNSYFTLNKASKTRSTYLIERKSIKLEENLKEILFKYIGFLITKNDLNLNRILFEKYKEVDKIFSNNSISSACKLNDKYSRKFNDYKHLWSRMIKLMDKFLNKAKNNEDYLMHSFFMILAFEAVRMFDSYQDSLNVVEDLEIAFNKSQVVESKKTNRLSSSEDEPEWIEIVIEMLLSLYALNNRWIRNAVTVLFKKLIPILTPNSVELIIELLEPQAEEDLIMKSDDDEDDDDGGSDKKTTNGKVDDEESGIEDDKTSGGSSSADEKKKSKEVVTTNGHANISNGKKASTNEDDEDEDDDEEEDDDDDEEADKIDEELKKAVDKALGAGAVHNSDDEDLDDEQMFKYDEALAAAFKIKKNIKTQENDVLQYRSKVLDLINEVFKSTQRLDLIVHSIHPMLNVLFESQNKSNLKGISQRIISFFINLKNIRKFNESKLPEIDELFQLLSHIIGCSVTNFNATNVLVEISIFCVRLIQHIANNENKDRLLIQQKLTDVYSNLIKNFYTKNDSKVNPAIHKEYLLRFPSVSLPLAEQMIEFATLTDVKLHKKTITLVTLNQVVNNQMFTSVDPNTLKTFMGKIFSFFKLLIDQIIADENVHVKFVDASLNLVGRVLNLSANLVDKDYVSELAEKLLTFNKETKFKQAYKSKCQNLLNLCKSKFGAKKHKMDEEQLSTDIADSMLVENKKKKKK